MKDKLLALLNQRKWSMADLAKQSGVSRQSIYNMFGKSPVFNSSFVKLLATLGVDYQHITAAAQPLATVLGDAPPRVRNVILKLIQFCDQHQASLIAFGSRARGRRTLRADWDFGVYCTRPEVERSLRLLKQQCCDAAFPYRVDVVLLNHAPAWFIESIRHDAVLVHGSHSLNAIFAKVAA